MTDAASYRAVGYAELPDWENDDHALALTAFLKSCERVLFAAKSGALIGKAMASPAVLSACDAAGAQLTRKPERAAAKAYFEANFTPHRILHGKPNGVLTGYFEPLMDGALTKQGRYQTPIFKRPADLVTLIAEAQGDPSDRAQTHARKTASGLQPYPTRAEIEGGALAGHGLELVYLKDSVDVFLMQVQGSGRIKLAEGGFMRVTYDGKNGHPYTSIGRLLADSGQLPADKVSLDAVARWLRADAERGGKTLQQNASYVFFRELKGKEATAAIGVLEMPLTPGRSLAVDASIHALGMPIYVSAPTLTHVQRGMAFNRLMIAQDVGGAIKGPERADIFFGSGEEAGKLAGITRHPGNLFALLPTRPVEPRAPTGTRSPDVARNGQQAKP